MTSQVRVLGLLCPVFILITVIAVSDAIRRTCTFLIVSRVAQFWQYLKVETFHGNE